jgi:hypothetical protein
MVGNNDVVGGVNEDPLGHPSMLIKTYSHRPWRLIIPTYSSSSTSLEVSLETYHSRRHRCRCRFWHQQTLSAFLSLSVLTHPKLYSNPGLNCSVCWPFLSTTASSSLSGLLPLLDLVLVCSNSEFGRSTPDDSGLVSLIHGRCRFAKGDDSKGDR